MKLFALVLLAMCAFAANSLLVRFSLVTHGMDPLGFASIRTAAGAVMLWVLVFGRQAAFPVIFSVGRAAGATALAGYMIAFSWAYISLDAGLGALILFGVIQIVMFGWTVWRGTLIPLLRWVGSGIALLGLCVLLWPSGPAIVPVGGAISMVVAGISWAAYTLMGRAESDPLGATASNFLLCLPLVLGVTVWIGIDALPFAGVLTAVVAGAITSGLGYALWYRLLPQLQTTVAGIAQLSVPVLAVAAGTVILDEAVTLRLFLAAALVLGGIGVSLIARRKVS